MYSIEDVYIDEGGGPGSAATLQVIAPDVERGEEAAKHATAKHAEDDYVMMDLSLRKPRRAAMTRTPPRRSRSESVEPSGLACTSARCATTAIRLVLRCSTRQG
jgi:hypothetical protein